MSLILMEPTGRNVEFAAVMERIAAGRSSRELHRITVENGEKVSHSTIADARWGTAPGFKLLQKLLRGLRVSEQDAADAFRTAGYLPDAPAPAVSRIHQQSSDSPFAQHLTRGIKELQKEFGTKWPFIGRLPDNPDAATVEDAESLLIQQRVWLEEWLTRHIGEEVEAAIAIKHPDPALSSPRQIAEEGRRQLEYEFKRPVVVEWEEDATAATEESARAWVAYVRGLLEQGKI